MLVPLGILLPLLLPYFRKTLPFVVFLLIFNLGIEITQYIGRLGSFDIDDLILNSAGALVVYMVIRIILSVGRRSTRGGSHVST